MRHGGKILYIIGQVTDENMEHALCMLATWGYKHTVRISNTYCYFSKCNNVFTNMSQC